MTSEKEVKFRIEFNLTEKEIQRLVVKAVMLGYRRVEPRKAWTTFEYKEAARMAILNLVKEDLDNSNSSDKE